MILLIGNYPANLHNYGDYPSDAKLWDVPICIYNSDGNIRYYEFRVIVEEKVIGVITGSALKSFGCPIIFEGAMDGYADELSSLYEKGLINDENLPRIIDNNYPSYSIGLTSDTKSGIESFDCFLNAETGQELDKDDISTASTYSEAIERFPELVPNDIDPTKYEALIADYSKQIDIFWKAAYENKGHIGEFDGVRGSSQPAAVIRTSLSGFESQYNINRYRYYTQSVGCGSSQYILLVNYGPCSCVAAGFVLDYLSTFVYRLAQWNNIYGRSARENALRAIINPFNWGNGNESAMPWDINDAIKYYSDYKLTGSLYSIPKQAINNDLPGISLRIFGSGFAHYRPVIAYQQDGWGPFSWTKMKIIDRFDATDKMHGSWETYIPLYHLGCWNVEHK